MPSRRSAVAPTVERVLAASDGTGLSSDQRMDLAVALAEALSNAAIHGNRLRASSQVRVTLWVTPGRAVQVEVRDSGRGFDFEATVDPTDPARVLRLHGRGLFLMRRLVDRLKFYPPGNRVCLTKLVRPRQ